MGTVVRKTRGSIIVNLAWVREELPLEELTKKKPVLSFQVKNILTSNKIWEVITSVHLNHNVNSEQGGRKGSHDAYDKTGNQYEYKIY